MGGCVGGTVWLLASSILLTATPHTQTPAPAHTHNASHLGRQRNRLVVGGEDFLLASAEGVQLRAAVSVRRGKARIQSDRPVEGGEAFRGVTCQQHSLRRGRARSTAGRSQRHGSRQGGALARRHWVARGRNTQEGTDPCASGLARPLGPAPRPNRRPPGKPVGPADLAPACQRTFCHGAWASPPWWERMQGERRRRACGSRSFP